VKTSEREHVLQSYERWAKNIKQAAYRDGRKAREAIEAWFSPLGHPLDLIDYERAAEKQQMTVRQLAAVEKSLNEMRAKCQEMS